MITLSQRQMDKLKEFLIPSQIPLCLAFSYLLERLFPFLGQTPQAQTYLVSDVVAVLNAFSPLGALYFRPPTLDDKARVLMMVAVTLNRFKRIQPIPPEDFLIYFLATSYLTMKLDTGYEEDFLDSDKACPFPSYCAQRFNEEDKNDPTVTTSDKSQARKFIAEAERTILKALDYRVERPSPQEVFEVLDLNPAFLEFILNSDFNRTDLIYRCSPEGDLKNPQLISLIDLLQVDPKTLIQTPVEPLESSPLPSPINSIDVTARTRYLFDELLQFLKLEADVRLLRQYITKIDAIAPGMDPNVPIGIKNLEIYTPEYKYWVERLWSVNNKPIHAWTEFDVTTYIEALIKMRMFIYYFDKENKGDAERLLGFFLSILATLPSPRLFEVALSKIDINIQDSKGYTPILWLCHPKITTYFSGPPQAHRAWTLGFYRLINKGADVNHRTEMCGALELLIKSDPTAPFVDVLLNSKYFIPPPNEPYNNQRQINEKIAKKIEKCEREVLRTKLLSIQTHVGQFFKSPPQINTASKSLRNA